MKHLFFFISRPVGWLMVFLASLSVVLLPDAAGAHPMPNSVVLLTIHANRIDAEIQIPLVELQSAFGHAVNDSSASLLDRLGPQLRAYLTEHIRPQSPDGRPWTVSVSGLTVQETQNPINGTYRELTAQVRLVPPAGTVQSGTIQSGTIQSGTIQSGEDVRRFIFHYDVVLHQVVTHKILVSVRQDWARGQVADESPVQVGVIELDIVNNRILPLVVNLAGGSAWTGFVAMVKLGTRHIAEGTDHLLFLLVLLLPAPLLVRGGPVRKPHLPHRNTAGPTFGPPGTGQSGWGSFGGVRYSLRRLLWIVTAFTIGHSFTLLLGAMAVRRSEWVRLPGQPVEVLIALSILVSAIHAVRPLFPGREAWVAAGFGLVHGLAFASALANLHLDAGPMALSILGFNLGIELMQLFVISLTIPWLILLSRTPIYPFVRQTGAGLAAVAALAWVVERVTNQRNPLTSAVEQVAEWAPYALGLLILLALFFTWRTNPAKKLPL